MILTMREQLGIGSDNRDEGLPREDFEIFIRLAVTDPAIEIPLSQKASIELTRE